MVEFDLWIEAFIFVSVFGTIVLVPCVLVLLIGKKMINRLGLHPTNTPRIQLSIMVQLLLIEVVTFSCLLVFYHVFSQVIKR